MRQSHEMAQTQADGQHLRHLSARGPASPTLIPRANADNESQLAHDFDPKAVVIRLARNRPALYSLRRTRKMRYRLNLDFLSASFPLADEPKKEAERAQGLTSTQILGQKKVSVMKIREYTDKELKWIRDGKAKEKAEKAQQRLKEQAARSDVTGRKDEKVTGKSIQKIAGQSLEKVAQKSTERTAKKVVEKNVVRRRYVGTAVNTTERPAPFNMFLGKHIMPVSKSAEKSKAENTEKAAAKNTEKTARKSTEKTAPKSTGSTAASKSGKKTLRAKMMPAPETKRW